MRTTILVILLLLVAGGANATPAEPHPPWDGAALDARLRSLERMQDRLTLLARPASLDAARIHIEAKRFERALAILRTRAEERVDLLPEILAMLVWSDFHDREEHRAGVQAIEAAVKRALESLPSEVAGRVDLAWARLPREDRKERLERLAEKHGDDPIGLLARYELLRSGGSTQERIDRLEAFAAKHPGTEGSRRALIHCIFQYGHNVTTSGKNANSADLYEKARALFDRLSCEGPSDEETTRAREYLAGFYLGKRALAKHEGAAERLLVAYRRWFLETLTDALPGPDTVWRVRHVFRTLHEAAGMPEKALFDEVESLVKAGMPRTTGLYLRGMLLAQDGDHAAAAEALKPLVENDVPAAVRRPALAALAGVLLGGGRLEEASRRYVEHARLFPTSTYRWLALLRAAYAVEGLGRLEEAARSYRKAAATIPEDPVLGILAHAAAARVFERMGKSDEAALERRRALDRWTDDLVGWLHFLPVGDGFDLDEDRDEWVSRDLLSAAASADADGSREAFEAFLELLTRARAVVEKGGDPETLVAPLGAAVARLHADQRLREPRTALERDVMAVREAAFPEAEAPEQKKPHVVVDPEITVTFSDGGRTDVELRHAFTRAKGVVFLTASQRRRIGEVLSLEDRDHGETMRKLLDRFFPVHRGHWGGFHVATYPIFRGLRFADPDRNEAILDFRKGFQGGEIRLRRTKNGFEVVSTDYTWIE